ncbi:MAG: ribonuclease Z [Muribaculaceae bacterium]|nr:ribonuclease Z [Muribaculaceae bacterium]
MDIFELNILGCGSAKSTLQHLPSCQVLNVRGHLMMIDCGEGAQLEMQRHHLKFSRLKNIFISHLHGDHCFGLPGLLSTMALHNIGGTITVHIFKEGAELFGRMLDFFCRDRSFDLKFNIIDTHKAVIYEDNAITVSTFPVTHRVPCVGFLFREKPKLRHINAWACQQHEVPPHAMNSLRQGLDYVAPGGIVIPNSELTTDADPSISYAYCSDTKYSKRVINAVNGVDWIYHEATYDDANIKNATKRYHSTARQAGMVAREAGAKKLVMGHYSSRYQDIDLLLREAQQEFPCTIAANEGMKIDLSKIE